VTERQGNSKELRGRDLAKALVLLGLFGAAYVGWKYVKHNWLADHGYLPEGMRDYWVVFGVAWVGILLWAAKTRLRL
jgi:hypothetical protein